MAHVTLTTTPLWWFVCFVINPMCRIHPFRRQEECFESYENVLLLQTRNLFAIPVAKFLVIYALHEC